MVKCITKAEVMLAGAQKSSALVRVGEAAWLESGPSATLERSCSAFGTLPSLALSRLLTGTSLENIK